MALKRRLIASVIVLCLLAAAFTGCSGAKMKSPMGLMRPPLSAGVDSELKSAFLAAATGKGKAASSSDISLISPLSGDYRSAFVLHDIDNDGVDEALVFYKLENEPSKEHMNVLDNVNGKWVSVGDFSGTGTGVNFVRFVQMTETGYPAILVSQSLYENDSSKILSVYVCTGTEEKLTVKDVCTEVYSIMENIDVDSDGQLDIFLIQQDLTNNNSPRSTAKVFKMNASGTLDEFGTARLDGGISKYCSIQTDKVSASSPLRIYVDAIKGDAQAITEVLYWSTSSKSLVTPMFSLDTQSNMFTARSELLASQDYDGDGIIEIPSQRPLMGSRKYESPKNLYAQMNVTSWIEVHSSKDFQFTETLVNAADSYILDFKPLENIMGEFTVYSYINTRTWVFKEYSARYETAGEDLFAIICTTKDSANKNGVKPENYLIENDDGTVIYFEAREKGAKAGITVKSIKPCIKVFKDKELVSK